MSLNRYAKQRDANEPEIVAELKEIPGVSVERLDQPCDLLVGYRGRTYLLEIKDPNRLNGSKDPLTDGQKKFIARWRGDPMRVVETAEEALAVVLGDE